jgi:hypothetical protein
LTLRVGVVKLYAEIIVFGVYSFVPTRLRHHGHILFSTRNRDTHAHTIIGSILANTIPQHSLILIPHEIRQPLHNPNRKQIGRGREDGGKRKGFGLLKKWVFHFRVVQVNFLNVTAPIFKLK